MEFFIPRMYIYCEITQKYLVECVTITVYVASAYVRVTVAELAITVYIASAYVRVTVAELVCTVVGKCVSFFLTSSEMVPLWSVSSSSAR